MIHCTLLMNYNVHRYGMLLVDFMHNCIGQKVCPPRLFLYMHSCIIVPFLLCYADIMIWNKCKK